MSKKWVQTIYFINVNSIYGEIKENVEKPVDDKIRIYLFTKFQREFLYLHYMVPISAGIFFLDISKNINIIYSGSITPITPIIIFNRLGGIVASDLK